jgi:hypothetical protein
LPSAFVPVAVVFAVALAKNEEKLLAGDWKIAGTDEVEPPPEQPASTAPSAATAAPMRIPGGGTRRIPTPRILND